MTLLGSVSCVAEVVCAFGQGARRMIVLNIITASHGLRPARDLRALSGRRHTASKHLRKSFHGTTPSIFASGSFLAPSPAYRFERSKTPSDP